MVHWALYQENLNIHSWIISCPDGITPNSGLTGLSILILLLNGWALFGKFQLKKSIIGNPTNSEMDNYTPEYSLKNIPFPSYHVFRLALTEKIVDFVKRLRWKAFFYLDSCKNTDDIKKDVCNLKSQNTPPNNRLLDLFETDLFKLIKMVKFKKVRNNFQMKLSKDIKEVKTSNYIWVRSDKSKNIYKIKPLNIKKF